MNKNKNSKKKIASVVLAGAMTMQMMTPVMAFAEDLPGSNPTSSEVLVEQESLDKGTGSESSASSPAPSSVPSAAPSSAPSAVPSAEPTAQDAENKDSDNPDADVPDDTVKVSEDEKTEGDATGEPHSDSEEGNEKDANDISVQSDEGGTPQIYSNSLDDQHTVLSDAAYTSTGYNEAIFGASQVVYQDETMAGPYIIVKANATSYTYGDALKLSGVTFECHGLKSGTFSVDMLKDAVFSVDKRGQDSLDETTSVGSYTLAINCGEHNIKVGDVENVTVYSASNLFNGNAYAASVTINKRPIEITPKSTSKTYGAADPAIGYDVTSGTMVNGDKLTGTLTREHLNGSAPGANEDVGAYDVIMDSATFGNSNYVVTLKDATDKFEVKKAAMTIHTTANGQAGLVEREYGEANPEIGWSASGLADWDSMDVKAGADGSHRLVQMANGTAFSGFETTTSAGYASPANQEYAVSIGNAPADMFKNYTVTVEDAHIKVTPRTVNVVTYDSAKTYGEDDNVTKVQNHTMTLPNTKGSTTAIETAADGKTALDPIENFKVVRQGGENVGTYNITFTQSGNSNYTFVQSLTGKLTVNKRDIYVKPADAKMIHGDAHPTFSLVYTSDGSNAENAFVNRSVLDANGGSTAIADTSDTAINTDSVNFIYDEDAFNHAGSGKVQVEGLDSANYNINYLANDMGIDVAPRPVKVIINSHNTVYGEAVDDFKADYEIVYDYDAYGEIEGDKEAMAGSDTLITDGVICRDIIKHVKDGGYNLTGSFANKDYKVTVEDGTYTVSPRKMTLNYVTDSSVYGDEVKSVAPNAVPDAAQGMESAFAAGENLDNLKLVTSIATNDAATLGSGVAVDWTSGEAAFIAKTTKYPDSAAKTVTVSGESIGSYANIKDAGVYSFSGVYDNPDYDVNVVDGKYTVSARNISVAYPTDDFVYGEKEATLVPTITGEDGKDVYGYTDTIDSLNLVSKISTPDGEVQESTMPGKYAVIGDIDNRNYNATFTAAKVSISKRPVTVIYESDEYVYGDKTANLTPSFSSGLGADKEVFAAGDTETDLGLSTIVQATAGNKFGNNVNLPGKYVVTGVANSDKYAVTIVNGDVEVALRPVDVLIDNKTVTYGMPDADLTYSVAYHGDTEKEALVNGDELTGKLYIDPDSHKDAGEYKILSTLSNDYYDVNYIPAAGANYSVEAAVIAVTLPTMEKLYGTETVLPTPAYTGFKWNDTAENTPLPKLDKVLKVAESVQGIKGDSPENAETIVEDAFTYAGSALGNYTFGAAAGTLKISRLGVTDAMYSVEGEKNAAGWYKETAAVKAAEGYQLSESDTLEGNTWSDTLTLDGDSKTTGKTFFVKRLSDGAITGKTTVSVMMDKTMPEVTNIGIGTSLTSLTGIMGNREFPHYDNQVSVYITAKDALSGIEKMQYYVAPRNEVSFNADGTVVGDTTRFMDALLFHEGDDTYFNVNVTPDFDGYIVARCIDAAGNVSTVSFAAMNIVTPKPAPNVEHSEHPEIGEAIRNGTWGKPDNAAAVARAITSVIPKTGIGFLDNAILWCLGSLIVMGAALLGFLGFKKFRKNKNSAEKKVDSSDTPKTNSEEVNADKAETAKDEEKKD